LAFVVTADRYPKSLKLGIQVSRRACWKMRRIISPQALFVAHLLSAGGNARKVA
jgi:hypothetical protein